MTKPRSYRLLCPIARALDRVGDRWALLILRDLHAGPARFNDIQNGLVGLASNLLTTRLRQLEEDGLVCRVKRDAATYYELTELGETTDELLFELAKLGAPMPPNEDMHRPGNLRAIVAPLQLTCRRVMPEGLSLRAELIVDDEPFSITAADGLLHILAGPAIDPQAVIATDYEASVAVSDGRMSMGEYAANHIEIVSGEPEAIEALSGLLAAAMLEMAA